jgi:predicted oxidoreductase
MHRFATNLFVKTHLASSHLCGIIVSILWSPVAGGGMVDAQHQIEELNERTLAIAAASELSPAAYAVAFVVKDPVRKTGRGHVLRAGQERSDLVVEYHGIAFLIHSIKQAS